MVAAAVRSGVVGFAVAAAGAGGEAERKHDGCQLEGFTCHEGILLVGL
jgi:hypothetical protein